jgi:DNA-binding transcriptional LysR family regulator
VQSLGSTLTILALVNAGLGLALVPRGASAIRFERVRFRALELPSGICSELHLVWRDDNDNPAFAAVRESLRQAAREAQEQLATN